MSRRRRLGAALTSLYKEYGKPLVDDILDVLGDDADEALVRKTVKQQATPKPPAKAKKPPVKTAKPSAPKPKKITFPDEGEWDLPDLSEDVPVTFNTQQIKVPAQAGPPRGKIEAYHATPHRFEPEVKVRNIDDGFEFYKPRPSDLKVSRGLEVVADYPLGRFRLDRMGTGAGAQMYGAGAYSAQAPNVARPYRVDNMPAGAFKPTIGGVDANLVYSRLLDKADRAPTAEGRPLYDRAALLEDIIHTGDTMDVEKAIAAGDYYAPDTADWFKREIAEKWDAPGALYTLDINAGPEQLMAWNTPIAEQPLVRNAVAPLMQQFDISEDELYAKYPLTGGDLYHILGMRGEARPETLLTGAGLPGIRYVDTGSGPGGTSTENYVIMQPDLINIKKRYRAGGLAVKRKK